jgi:hypothetical protein
MEIAFVRRLNSRKCLSLPLWCFQTKRQTRYSVGVNTFFRNVLYELYTVFAFMSIDSRHECNTNILNRIRRYLYRQFSKISSHLSIMSDYGLDDRSIDSRCRRKDFSSNLCVQTGCGAHPASCRLGTGGPFSGDKARPGRDADHSSPSTADVVNE